MARGVNKVILIGNLGAEPDIRNLPSGEMVATISVATTEGWKDKQTGEWRENTEWHRVSAFGRLADVIRQYTHKGSQIYVEGRIKTRKWNDRNTGLERYITEIVANDIQLLGSRNSNGADYGQNAGQTFGQNASSGFNPAAAYSGNQDVHQGFGGQQAYGGGFGGANAQQAFGGQNIGQNGAPSGVPHHTSNGMPNGAQLGNDYRQPSQPSARHAAPFDAQPQGQAPIPQYTAQPDAFNVAEKTSRRAAPETDIDNNEPDASLPF